MLQIVDTSGTTVRQRDRGQFMIVYLFYLILLSHPYPDIHLMQSKAGEPKYTYVL